MSAVKGQKFAELTVKNLLAMRNDRDFNLFYKTVKKSASTINDISTLTLPRKRKRPNHSIFQCFEDNPSTTGESYYSETAVNHFKLMYMEAANATINSFKDRFEKPRFKVSGQFEQLLLKSIRKDSLVDEIQTLQAKFQRLL